MPPLPPLPPLLRLHRDAPIARLELTAPDGFPRLSTSLLGELDEALSQLLTDPGCGALILHGSEKAFAAGADIAEVGSLSGLAALDFAHRTQLLFDRLATAEKPILAAIRGYCLGGGLDLALACHYRLAAPDALFGHPGATLGLLTGWGGTQRLPRLLGRARALELLLGAEPIPADQALRFGLINEIVPAEELLPRAVVTAKELANRRDAEDAEQAERAR